MVKMMNENIILPDFTEVDFSGLSIPAIVVYEKPKDFPNSYIGRVWDLGKNSATWVMVKRDSLKEIRETIPNFMVRMDRMNGDDPVIVEIWL